MEEIRQFSNNYDIIGITETWINSDINDSEVQIEGFNMFRADRKKGRGGGVILYITTKLAAFMCLEAELVFEEAVWCKIKLRRSYLLVGLCYRSPSSTESCNQTLLDSFDHVMKSSHAAHVLIMGDFNCPKINYSNGYVDNGGTVFEHDFFEKTQDLLLVQNIFGETRYRTGDLPSKLDYVFTDEEGLIDHVDYLTPVGKSDHVVLSWMTTVEPQEKLPNNEAKFLFHKGDYIPFKLYLSCINWS